MILTFEHSQDARHRSKAVHVLTILHSPHPAPKDTTALMFHVTTAAGGEEFWPPHTGSRGVQTPAVCVFTARAFPICSTKQLLLKIKRQETGGHLFLWVAWSN